MGVFEKWRRKKKKKKINDQPRLVDQLKDSFFTLDKDWRFTYINQKGEKLLLRKREELLGNIVWDEFPEAFRTTFYYEYNKAMTMRKPVQFQEYYSPLKTWFDVSAFPWNDGLAVHFQDITKEKEELDMNREHYQSLFENNPDAIYSLDLEGNYLSVNSSFERMLGYKKDEALRLNYKPIVVDEDYEKTKRHFQLAAKGEPQNYQVHAVSKQGERLTLSVTNIPILINNNIVGVYGIAKNITERIVEQEKLRKSEELHRLIGENSQDIISNSTADGLFHYVSPAVYHLLGYNPEELVGKSRDNLIHPDDLEAINNRSYCDSNIVMCRLRHKNGTYLWFEINNKVIRNKQGDIENILSVARDSSERIANEELIRKSEKLSMTGQLAAGIAHEIRNPLTAVKGFIQLMQNGQHLEKEYLDIMHSEITRVEGIIKELLLLSKPNKENFSDKNIVSVLKEVMTLMNTEALLANVRIISDYGSEDQYITCDENQLKQVLINLIQNGIEAMPSGGEILVQTYKNEQYVVVSIADTGHGIPKEILSNIGQPFYTTKANGTGLGLAVCLNIIENHKGTIEIDSEVDQGTTFTMKFPLIASNTYI
ncbi:PAS domain S-box protein [Ferdinandcohnia sp. Marseille-Q9671]